ncbi:phosphomannomutase [Methylomarinovum caldicuralii]|uniref:Phosphomannomutase n=1 Tax=Methylomarinovum caldicuralii TaxID=438856 RepID=A0AAU9C6B8_9GAMM|nr:phosphomannomutase [Methylomarinovum caldicuralii]BCX82785.1 phosphomannomutase [Methylomarinovum caldicuralii]
MSQKPTLRDILDHEPKQLRFGTSGVRGKVEELTDVEVYCLTRGTLDYFQTRGRLVCPGHEGEVAIPLAGDLRPSTERILQAVAKGIADAGLALDHCGRIPTPALTYYALQRREASFVVTGSHIPADRNGIKPNRCDGEVLKSDEPGIVEAVQRCREQEYGRPAAESPFGPDGMLKPEARPQLPPVDAEAAEVYRRRYREVFAPEALSGWRVLFFEYSAVGRELIPRILRDAGAEVIGAGRSDRFVPLDTEAISNTHLQMLGDLARQQDRHIDVILSTDGDSDRPLVVAVDGDELHFIPGDLLGAIVAEFLEADAVSVPISANPVLEEWLGAHGIRVRRTRIGSPYVIEAMQELLADGHRRVMAWEANGGFLLGCDIEFGGGVLKALPTRDATLPLLCVLAAAKRREGGLLGLLEAFPPCYGKSDLIDDFPQAESRRIVEYFTPEDARIKELRFEEDGIALFDAEGNRIGFWPEGSPEAQTWEAKKRLLESVFRPEDGFAPVVKLNVLDGVRCYFANGEIAHVRPSGNAPQLRIYAFADLRDRAREIAALAVAEPDGLLRRLARRVAAA